MTGQAAILTPGLELIVGLGNPGNQYTKTRHNAGFWFVDELARQYHLDFRPESKFHGDLCVLRYQGRDIRILKPTTFMNHSGRSVAAVARFYKIPVENILVVHDELDLPAGTARLKFGGGHGGHNGLRDMAALGSNQYWRLRIGISHPGDKSQVVGYVLKEPNKSDQQAIERSIQDVDTVLERMLQGEMEKAMHELHTGK